MGVEIPQSMTALVANRSLVTRISNYTIGNPSSDGVKLTTLPVPTITESEILIRVSSVALNPTDFKHIDVFAPKGAIIGCDYAGTVVRVGSAAPGGWSVGDRVAGATHGGLYTDRGSFAEYLKIQGDLAWKVPSSVTDEEATTFGISAVTAMLALNARLGVPWIDGGVDKGRSDTPILIYSGATAAGLYAIQLAKLAGLTVVATASPHSFDLVKEYGADHVFDYRSPTAVEEIIQAHPDIDRALDCYSEGSSTEFCANVVRKSRGWVVTLLDTGKTELDGVKIDWLLAYTALGAEFQYLSPLGPKFGKVPANHEALRRFYASLPKISQLLKAPPLKVLDIGFESLNAGLDLLRQGKVSGTKLVARLY